jgi:hypothetical protein
VGHGRIGPEEGEELLRDPQLPRVDGESGPASHGFYAPSEGRKDALVREVDGHRDGDPEGDAQDADRDPERLPP